MTNLRRLCLVFLLVFLPGDALAVGEPASRIVLSPEIVESLRSARVMDRAAAIESLGNDPSDQAFTLLKALQEGALYVSRDSNELLVLDENAKSGEFVISGETIPVTDKDGLRKVGTSNSQRERISSLLSARMLRHPDANLRRRAVAGLLSDAGRVGARDKPLLLALLQKETDEDIGQNLALALALLAACDAAAAPDELIGAAALLRDNALPGAAQALEKLKSSEHAGVAAAASEALEHKKIVAEWAAMLETLFFGLSLGSVLILTSIGLAVTFGVMGVINMAHGELIMLGSYTVWGLQQVFPGQPGLALVLSIPAAFIVSGGMGMVLERLVIRHLYGRPLETLLATFGISLILQQMVRTLISPMNRAVESPDFMSGMWRLTSSISLTCNRVYILCFCLAVFALIYAVMHKTRLGLEVRAVTQNRAIARAMGVNSARVDAMTFALGSGVAGMAGVALSQLTNVGPNLGQSYIVDSFMVVVFGGVGNLWGTLSGGLILGLANKFLEPFSGTMLAKIILLAGLILFMQARPRGLFPERGRAAEN
ncbi:MAG: urea ABC transporter permease subunit UrtB [Desulfovibrio sp.]|jgi:urea transport system permease protein|nr:urea ABC transporter permease subunit UrtB [Desulfovibrio sp.]